MSAPNNTEERWLPVNFTFNPSLVSVRWLEFGTKRLLDPFWNQTVRSLKLTKPPARERVTDLSAIYEATVNLPPVNPSGIIFHVSRCGSTFLSNALGTGERVTVLSEARPIGMLFNPRAFAQSPFPMERWAAVRRDLVSAVLSIYGHSEHKCDPKVVIKCHAASLLQIDLIRSIWPSVPFVILIRDPIEVIVSNLATPGGWVKSRHRSLDRRTPFGWTASEAQLMSTEEYCARGIARFCDTARSNMDRKCMVIDYMNLNLTTIGKVADFFNIRIAPSDSSDLRNIITMYAKDPTRKRPFENDHERKQCEATVLVRAAVKQWAQESYEAIQSYEASIPISELGEIVVQ
jgi:hypothetical protein